MANIINVIVKDAETPEDDIVVPDTGWYTSSTESSSTGSSFVAPFIGIGVISFALLLILMFAKRKWKRISHFGTLSILAILGIGVSIYGIITNSRVSATDNLISITSSDTTITVVREEGAETDTTYGVATATIKLNETTPLGYTILAYTPDGNILKADTGDGTIEPVTTNNSALTNNTWGVALTDQAEVKAEDTVWGRLEDESNPLPVASFDESTTAGTTVTLRYGVLVDNTLPVGVYSANIEYKAYQRAYNITFDPGEGEITTPTKPVIIGEPIGELPTPVRTNYNFTGWYTEEAGGTKIDENTVPDQNSTYFAHWERITYSITFNPGEGTIIGGDAERTVQAGEPLGTLPEVARDNYTFTGWYTQETGGERVTTATIPTAGTSYYAHWSRDTYTITFNAGEGTIDQQDAERSVNAGDTIGTLPDATRTNYTLDGWYTEETGGTKITAETTPTGTTTYYAHWNRNEYTITFDLNGGNISGDTTNPTATVQAGDSLGTLPQEPSKTNYTFAGWYTAETGGDPVTTETRPDGTTTYFAHWDRIEYTITFDLNGGNISGDTTNPNVTVQAGETLGSLPQDPSKENHTFAGWYTAETGGDPVTTETRPDSTTTYFAHWDRIEYTITFDLNGGNISGDTTNPTATVYASDALGSLPTEPARTNYAFAGWYTQLDGGTEIDANTIPAGTTTYYAHWNRIEYTITFDLNGGNISGDTTNPTATVYAGDTLGNLPTDPTKEDFVFAGWFTAAEGGTEVTTATIPDGTTTYYAHWDDATLPCNPNATTIGTGNDTDAVCMQDVNDSNYASIHQSMTQDTQYKLRDNRDNKVYFVAKQADDKIWMTQNLDLCIGCEDTAALTSENTNLKVSGSGAYVDGYTEENGVITWTPNNKGKTGTIADLKSSYRSPRSAEGGEVYLYTSGTTDNDTVYESLSACIAAGHTKDECMHYHVGNYYNWTAAVASNDTDSLSTHYESADNSICPAGWRLPKGRDADITAENTEFGELLGISGIINSRKRNIHYVNDGFNNIRIDPLFLVRGSYVWDGELDEEGWAECGEYWSSSISTRAEEAYSLLFDEETIHPYISDDRAYGSSVRCVADVPISDVTVTFDTDGGSSEPDQTFAPGEKATRPATNPTKSGYNFVDWYTNDSYNALFDFDSPITTNTTIYARFVESRYIAEMNGDVYETIQSAADVAPSSQTTIRLLTDTSEKVTIGSGQDIILNLNSKTLSYVGSGENVIINKGNLTLENGTVSSTGGKGMINNNAGATLTTRNVGLAVTTTTPKQVIYNNGGTAYILEGTNIETQSSSAGAIDNHGGTMVIENARIVSTGTRQGVYNDNNGSLEIRGANTYISAKPDVGSTNRAAVQSVNGSLVITGGTIVSKDYAVTVQDGSFRLGTQDDAYDDENPEIRGGVYGIQSSVNYSVYDGIIEGKTAAVNDETKITGKETNYGKVSGTKDIDGTTYQTIYYETETEYTITFNLNGGNINGSTTNPTTIVQIGDTLGTLPADPTRTNYTFEGWYTELNGGTKITADTRPIESRSYFAHWNRIEYTVTYNLNGGNISGSTTNPTATVYAGETLGTLPTEPTRTNYTFDGWFTVETGGDEVTTGTIPTGTTTYFAHWTLVAVTFDDAYAAAGKTRDVTSGKYILQDMDNNICNAVSKSSESDYSDTQETQLVDLRDGKVYWVAKLLDGKCWMTQNLDYDLDSNTALVHASSDIGWGSDTTTMSWTPERSTIPASGISSDGTISEWDNAYSEPYSVDMGDWYWTDTWYKEDCTHNPYCNYLSGNENGKFSTSPYIGNGEHGHVGNYYNWPAAIASNNSRNYNTITVEDITGNPQNSVCPAGWRLPTISRDSDVDGSTNEFKRLTTLYGNTTSNDKAITAAPLWFIRGGSFEGRMNNPGNLGVYWSSTVVYNSGAFPMYFLYNGFVVEYSYGTFHGMPVRCVARNTSPTNLITFNANGGVVEDGNTTTRRITEGQALGALPEATREGRVFDGWYTEMDGGTKITDQTVPTGAITYYAHWATTFDGAYADAGMSKDATSDKYKMHEMTASICEAVTTGQTGELVDVRDGTVYHVGKLADDRCWLLDNLGLDAVTAKSNLSPANTNASQAAIDNFKVDSGTAPQDGWATTAVSYETGSSVYDQPRISIASKNVVPQGNDPLASTVLAEGWGVGVYYNYCAASIGTYCYDRSSGVDVDAASAIDVKNDICPAGWRMPTGGAISSIGTNAGGGEFQALYDAYPAISGGDNHYTRFRKIFRLPLSGHFDNGSPGNQGSDANVWSSTFYAGSGMYYLYASTSGIGLLGSIHRYYGFPVRCVADDVPKNLITFNANGGVVEGGNTTTRRITENQALGTLPETTRDGYAFDGWYTEAEGGTEITSQTVPTGTTTYYAHWYRVISFDEAYTTAGKSRDAISGKYRIQDMNKNICDAVSKSRKNDYSDTQETQLVDIRDGKTYWVAKLLDGHCWMTQNLDLDLETTANKVQTLTSENTDLKTFGSNGYDTSNGYSQDTNGIITWKPERATIPTSNISTDGKITGWTNDDSNPYSIDTGDWYWTDTWYTTGTYNYLSGNAGDKFSQTPYTGNGQHGHVGNYYNWTAAIASNDSISYNASTLVDITGNPQNSICPAGWRLATVGSADEFRRLIASYGMTTTNNKDLTATPLWFVRGGAVYSRSLYDSGFSGRYWSSTVYSSDCAYDLYFYPNHVDFAYSNYRYIGRSVRCIAR